MRCEVRMHNGAPTLFINDAPHNACMFWHSKPMDAGEDIRLFADAGVHLFTTGLSAEMQQDGSFDVSHLTQLMRVILSANPKALVMPRVWLEPPKWWFEQHPDEMQVHYDAVTGDKVRRYVSFSSQRWLNDMGAALPNLLRLCEERWGDHIIGYHLCAGACGEWSYSWAPVLSGYSISQRAAFQRWLRERYGGDVGRLRRAWADDAVTFETAEVPRNRVRDRNAWPAMWSIFKPQSEQRCIDYLTFHSEAVADAITHFARITKRTLREMGREKICGVFYAYHIPNEDVPWAVYNAGHHAHKPVLESPDIDFISSPMTYNLRQAGGHYHSQLLPGSVRLHGKLYWCEDDTFTHLARETPWRPKCRDAKETADVLWRNFAGTLCEAGAYWWMDHDGEGWYRDDRLMAEVAAMARLAGQRLDSDKTPDAQIAVLASPDSMNYLRYDSALADALLPDMISELLCVGAPFDLYGVDDLELLWGQETGRQQPADTASWSNNYRMFIFLDALYLSDRQRAAIRRVLADGNRTALWFYGAGLAGGAKGVSHAEGALSTDAMAEVTGIRTRLKDRVGQMRAETYLTGTRLTWGTARHIGPEIVGDDPNAEQLGWMQYRGEPALLRKRCGELTSIWCAAPGLPACVVRLFAKEAGVHIYTETGDRFYRQGDLAVLHASFSGRRTLVLPRPADVFDVRRGRSLARDALEVELNLNRGETAVLRLMVRGRGAAP